VHYFPSLRQKDRLIKERRGKQGGIEGGKGPLKRGDRRMAGGGVQLFAGFKKGDLIG